MTSEERDLMLHVGASVEKLGISAFCKLSGMSQLSVRKCMCGSRVRRDTARRAKAACDMVDNPWIALLLEKRKNPEIPDGIPEKI